MDTLKQYVIGALTGVGLLFAGTSALIIACLPVLFWLTIVAVVLKFGFTYLFGGA